MKNLKQNSGITMIALIITIILMVILAAIAFNYAVGDKGVINRAEVAGEKQLAATAKDQVLAQYEYTTEGKIDLEKTKSNIETSNIEGVKTVKIEDGSLKVDLENEEVIETKGYLTTEALISSYAKLTENGVLDQEKTKQSLEQAEIEEIETIEISGSNMEVKLKDGSSVKINDPIWARRGITAVKLDKVYIGELGTKFKINSDGSIWQDVEGLGGESYTSAEEVEQQIKQEFFVIVGNNVIECSALDIVFTLQGDTIKFEFRGTTEILEVQN